MKKVLLSALAVSASLFAVNAQDANDNLVLVGTSVVEDTEEFLNGDPYTFDNLTTGVNVAGFDTIAGASGGAGVYYVGGAGFGAYDEDGDPVNLTWTPKVADTKFKVTFNAAAGQKIKFQLKVSDTESYGLEEEITTSSAVENQLLELTVSDFSLIVGNDPDGSTFITDAKLNSVNALELISVCTGNTGDCDADVVIQKIWLRDSNNADDDTEEYMEEVGLFDFATGNDFEVYPNPATSTVNFATALTNGAVYNAQGVVVAEFARASDLNVSDLQEGVYVIKATEGSSRFVVK